MYTKNPKFQELCCLLTTLFERNLTAIIQIKTHFPNKNKMYKSIFSQIQR